MNKSCFVLVPLLALGIAVLDFGCRGEEDRSAVATRLKLDEATSEQSVDFEADETFARVTESDAVELEIEGKLLKLGQYFSDDLQGFSPDNPVFVSSKFSGTGIDRESFKVRFNGDKIKIGRWQVSSSAPVFEEADALFDFTQNVFLRWKQASAPRIEFKIYQAEITDQKVVANLVVEIFGQTNLNSVSQATSLWRTNWSGEKGSLNLESVAVLGREELVVSGDNGQVFKDCTSSIIRKCDAWDSQLRFGLDQLARQTPGLSVIGNHGVAVGDINDDGLDDLYVCEGHGLPNLLLLQNPDGTVRNAAPDSGVDLLDDSRSALIVDLDNDGDQDLAVATDVGVVLFSNNGNENFQLESKLSIGFGGSSLSAADFDLDGDLDLFLCKTDRIRDVADFVNVPDSYSDSKTGGRNVLLRNDEGWKFSDATEECGFTEVNHGHSKSATWLDFDLDGDSDLFVANQFGTSRLFENQNGWFSDVTSKQGLLLPSQARSVSVGEFNRDSRPDIFVANDASNRQYRVIKNRLDANAINEDAGKALIAQSQVWFSREVSADNDDDNLAGSFRGYPLPTPIFSTESAFGSAVTDINNDGLEDILVANGYLSRVSSDDLQSWWSRRVANELATNGIAVEALRKEAFAVSDLVRSGFSLSGNQRNRCYLNIGSIGFANISAGCGLDVLNDARSLAITDWDNDGDNDVVMTSRNGPRLRIFRNQLESGNQFISLSLVGTESNRDAIGARVEVRIENSSTPTVRTVTAGSGLLAQSSKRLLVGLGNNATSATVDVVWPGGKRQRFGKLTVNRNYVLIEDESEAAERTTTRYELALPGEQLEQNVDAPPPRRSLFYPVSVLPRISIEDHNGGRYLIENATEEALLAIFHDQSDASAALLEDFANRSHRLNELGIGCVAAHCSRPGKKGNNVQVDWASLTDKRFSWPWPAGDVSNAGLGKLRLVLGEWFSNQHLPTMPFGILLDRDGAVKAFYPAKTLSPEAVLRDRSLVESGFGKRWEELTGRPGRWVDKRRTSDLTRLKDRFIDLGLDDEATYINQRIAPATAVKLVMRAIELASMNDFDLAEKFLDRALTVHPQCIDAYVEKGKLLRKIASTRQNEKEERVDLLDESARSFEKALQIDPRNIDAVVGFADAGIDQNKVTPAIEKLKEFVEQNPDSPKVSAILGRLLFSQKKYLEAATYLTSAFDAHPTLPFVAGDLGFIYLGSGEMNQAKKFLRLAHRQQPGDRNILRLLGEAEFAVGNHAEAIRLFDQYLKEDPKHLRSSCILAWILSTSPYQGMRDSDRALQVMAPFMELYGESSAYVNEIMAAAYANEDDFEAALRHQDTAKKLLERKETTDAYTESQLLGLRKRSEIFKNALPWRNDDLSEIPIRIVGQRNH